MRSFGLSSVSQLPSLDSFGEEDNQQLMLSELEEGNKSIDLPVEKENAELDAVSQESEA